MKTFHIKAPRNGAPSAAVVGYEYDTTSKRTRTVYLGSVQVDADPDEPGRALRLQPGKLLCGQPFALTSEHLELVRDWLEEHGSYREMQRDAQRALELERIVEAEAQDRLRGRIEAELRVALEGQWRAEFDAQVAAQRADPMQAAVDALATASAFVKSEAKRLRQGGIRLARIRSTQLEAGQSASELDRLQARANRVRLAAFDAFATGCKEAGLMAAQKRGKKRSVK